MRLCIFLPWLLWACFSSGVRNQSDLINAIQRLERQEKLGKLPVQADGASNTTKFTSHPLANGNQTADSASFEPTAAPEPVELATAVVMPDDTCKSYKNIGSKPPAFIGELGFVLTAVQRPCITFAGESGFYSDSNWVAMGIPCSGGGGTVEWEGKEERPKTVTLALATDCPMQPNASRVAKFGVSYLGFDTADNLIAHNPFILQFWSLPAYPDAGTGYGIAVRSRKAVDMVWYRLKKQKPINVHLYGRENSWIKGNNLYFINANIVSTSDYRFRLDVVEVRHLSNMEISEARRRCDMLRPKPNCELIF